MNPTAQEQSNSKKTQPNGLKELPSGLRNQEKPGSKRNEFLKVAPSLFTPEKLPLFDSLDLYTALIRSSNHLEQGERLHNLSWRIMNKALLKEHELNKSKKRDGVKNLYRVINPANSGQFPHPPQSRQASFFCTQTPGKSISAKSATHADHERNARSSCSKQTCIGSSSSR